MAHARSPVSLTEIPDNRKTRSVFSRLYGSDGNVIRNQLVRYRRILKEFGNRFPEGEVQWFSAPGRTEIGGNHTDHNHGQVLAAGIDLDSVAAVVKVSGPVITVYSEGFPAQFTVDTTDLGVREKEQRTTAALIRGIAARFSELGYRVGGFNAFISSSVMVGSGLSSSASIEVLLGAILNTLYNGGKIKPEALAMIGRYAENVYFGKPCGLMDQMTCAVGGIVTIDFKNPKKPEVTKVNFDFSRRKYRLVVVDTGGSHADLTDDYASIPTEMKTVAAHFGKQVCREIGVKKIYAAAKDLRAAAGDRALLRALHFLGENERVTRQVAALRAGDFFGFLDLVTESGDSSFKWLQNCYTTKNPSEQGISLALAFTRRYLDEIGEGACRVHGGGFAGTILVFLPEKHLKGYKRLMEPVFGKKSTLVLSVRPYGTVHLPSLAS